MVDRERPTSHWINQNHGYKVENKYVNPLKPTQFWSYMYHICVCRRSSFLTTFAVLWVHPPPSVIVSKHQLSTSVILKLRKFSHLSHSITAYQVFLLLSKTRHHYFLFSANVCNFVATVWNLMRIWRRGECTPRACKNSLISYLKKFTTVISFRPPSNNSPLFFPLGPILSRRDGTCRQLDIRVHIAPAKKSKNATKKIILPRGRKGKICCICSKCTFFHKMSRTRITNLLGTCRLGRKKCRMLFKVVTNQV